MKIACLTFTYPKDAYKAFVGSKLLPSNWDRYWVLDKSDEDMPVPEGISKEITTFDRGTHLNGKETIYGFIQLLNKMFFEYNYDIVLKLDSDTAIYSPNCFVNPIIEGGSDFVYIRRYPSEYSVPIANGICYAFSKKCMDYIKGVDFKDLIMIHHGSEDSVISHYLTMLHPWPLISQVNKSLIDWTAQRYCEHNTIAGHYGYVSNNEMLKRINEILAKQNRPIIEVSELINSKFHQDISVFYNNSRQ